jgi:peptidyl-prolyl cis-trans isomerase C
VSTPGGYSSYSKGKTMVKSHLIRRGTLFSFLLASSVAAQNTSVDAVVATIGSTEITIGHVLDVKRQLPEQYQSLGDDVLFSGIVEQLIQQEVLARSVTIDPYWMAAALENQRRSLLSLTVIDEVRANVISEAALRTAYQEKYTSKSSGQEYKASHILVDTAEEANQLLSKLDEGMDFGSLAQEYSTGPSGPNGGDLGWFGKGQMVPTFEAAVQVMAVGTYTGPVQTQFGYHLIRLDDLREIIPPSLNEVRNQLEVELQNAAVEAYISSLMTTLKVVYPETPIDPSILSTLELKDD